jgi:hypothetical protein
MHAGISWVEYPESAENYSVYALRTIPPIVYVDKSILLFVTLLTAYEAAFMMVDMYLRLNTMINKLVASQNGKKKKSQ